MADYEETDSCRGKQIDMDRRNEKLDSDEPPASLGLPALDKITVNDEEKRLVRKLDMRIIPTISIIYLFACKSGNVLQNDKYLTPLLKTWTGQTWATLDYKGSRKTSSAEIQQGISSTGRTQLSSSPT